jgi:hypothetical protein
LVAPQGPSIIELYGKSIRYLRVSGKGQVQGGGLARQRAAIKPHVKACAQGWLSLGVHVD